MSTRLRERLRSALQQSIALGETRCTAHGRAQQMPTVQDEFVGRSRKTLPPVRGWQGSISWGKPTLRWRLACRTPVQESCRDQ